MLNKILHKNINIIVLNLLTYITIECTVHTECIWVFVTY